MTDWTCDGAIWLQRTVLRAPFAKVFAQHRNIILICPVVLSLSGYVLAAVQAISMSHTWAQKKHQSCLDFKFVFAAAVLVDGTCLKSSELGVKAVDLLLHEVLSEKDTGHCIFYHISNILWSL